MRDSSNTVCFTCGLPSGDPTRLNHLPGGQVCPTCRDRLLAHLPPALPAWGEVFDETEVAEEPDEVGELQERSPLRFSPRDSTFGPQLPDTPA